MPRPSKVSRTPRNIQIKAISALESPLDQSTAELKDESGTSQVNPASLLDGVIRVTTPNGPSMELPEVLVPSFLMFVEAIQTHLVPGDQGSCLGPRHGGPEGGVVYGLKLMQDTDGSLKVILDARGSCLEVDCKDLDSVMSGVRQALGIEQHTSAGGIDSGWAPRSIQEDPSSSSGRSRKDATIRGREGEERMANIHMGATISAGEQLIGQGRHSSSSAGPDASTAATSSSLPVHEGRHQVAPAALEASASLEAIANEAGPASGDSVVDLLCDQSTSGGVEQRSGIPMASEEDRQPAEPADHETRRDLVEENRHIKARHGEPLPYSEAEGPSHDKVNSKIFQVPEAPQAPMNAYQLMHAFLAAPTVNDILALYHSHRNQVVASHVVTLLTRLGQLVGETFPSEAELAGVQDLLPSLLSKMEPGVPQLPSALLAQLLVSVSHLGPGEVSPGWWKSVNLELTSKVDSLSTADISSFINATVKLGLKPSGQLVVQLLRVGNADLNAVCSSSSSSAPGGPGDGPGQSKHDLDPHAVLHSQIHVLLWGMAGDAANELDVVSHMYLRDNATKVLSLLSTSAHHLTTDELYAFVMRVTHMMEFFSRARNGKSGQVNHQAVSTLLSLLLEVERRDGCLGLAGAEAAVSAIRSVLLQELDDSQQQAVMQLFRMAVAAMHLLGAPDILTLLGAVDQLNLTWTKADELSAMNRLADQARSSLWVPSYGEVSTVLESMNNHMVEAGLPPPTTGGALKEDATLEVGQVNAELLRCSTECFGSAVDAILDVLVSAPPPGNPDAASSSIGALWHSLALLGHTPSPEVTQTLLTRLKEGLTSLPTRSLTKLLQDLSSLHVEPLPSFCHSYGLALAPGCKDLSGQELLGVFRCLGANKWKVGEDLVRSLCLALLEQCCQEGGKPAGRKGQEVPRPVVHFTFEDATAVLSSATAAAYVLPWELLQRVCTSLRGSYHKFSVPLFCTLLGNVSHSLYAEDAQGRMLVAASPLSPKVLEEMLTYLSAKHEVMYHDERVRCVLALALLDAQLSPKVLSTFVDDVAQCWSSLGPYQLVEVLQVVGQIHDQGIEKSKEAKTLQVRVLGQLAHRHASLRGSRSCSRLILLLARIGNAHSFKNLLNHCYSQITEKLSNNLDVATIPASSGTTAGPKQICIEQSQVLSLPLPQVVAMLEAIVVGRTAPPVKLLEHLGWCLTQAGPEQPVPLLMEGTGALLQVCSFLCLDGGSEVKEGAKALQLRVVEALQGLACGWGVQQQASLLILMDGMYDQADKENNELQLEVAKKLTKLGQTGPLDLFVQVLGILVRRGVQVPSAQLRTVLEGPNLPEAPPRVLLDLIHLVQQNFPTVPLPPGLRRQLLQAMAAADADIPQEVLLSIMPLLDLGQEGLTPGELDLLLTSLSKCDLSCLSPNQFMALSELLLTHSYQPPDSFQEQWRCVAEGMLQASEGIAGVRYQGDAQIVDLDQSPPSRGQVAQQVGNEGTWALTGPNAVTLLKFATRFSHSRQLISRLISHVADEAESLDLENQVVLLGLCLRLVNGNLRVTEVAAHLLGKLKVDGLRSEEVIKLMRGLENAGCRPGGELVRSCLVTLETKGLRTLKPHELVAIIWTCVQWRMVPPGSWVKSCLECVETSLQSQSSQTARQWTPPLVANLLRSLCALGVGPSSQWCQMLWDTQGLRWSSWDLESISVVATLIGTHAISPPSATMLEAMTKEVEVKVEAALAEGTFDWATFIRLLMAYGLLGIGRSEDLIPVLLGGIVHHDLDDLKPTMAGVLMTIFKKYPDLVPTDAVWEVLQEVAASRHDVPASTLVLVAGAVAAVVEDQEGLSQEQEEVLVDLASRGHACRDSFKKNELEMFCSALEGMDVELPPSMDQDFIRTLADKEKEDDIGVLDVFRYCEGMVDFVSEDWLNVTLRS